MKDDVLCSSIRITKQHAITQRNTYTSTLPKHS